ncbi:MAG: hypothetical protein HFG65_17105 [Hungatella sp.]|nr:hypothetical protein [Hungatella sp.]
MVFLKNWGEIDERIDPAFYLNIMLLYKNIVSKAAYPVSTFREKVSMQRGRFGHRPRNDPQYYDGAYPFIQTGNVVKASTNNEKIEFTQTLNELGLSTSRLFDEKAVIITIAANIGYSAILDYPACFPDSLVALTTKDNSILLEYLNLYIRIIRDYIENLAPQAAQKNINLKQMSKLPIIVPDLDTQKLIISIMEKVYKEKIQREKEAQALLESIDGYLLQELGIKVQETKESILKNRVFISSFSDVFNGRLDPNFYNGVVQFNDAIYNGKFPVVDMHKLIVSITNGVEIRNYSEKGYRYLRVSDMGKNGMVDNNIRFVDIPNIPHKIQLTLNDLLISRSGSLGLANIVTEELEKTVLSSHIFRVRLLETTDKWYLQEYLRSSLGQYQFFKLNNGGIIPEITQDALRKIKVCIPPIEKQRIISEHIRLIRSAAEKLVVCSGEIINSAVLNIKKILFGGKL